MPNDLDLRRAVSVLLESDSEHQRGRVVRLSMLVSTAEQCEPDDPARVSAMDAARGLLLGAVREASGAHAITLRWRHRGWDVVAVRRIESRGSWSPDGLTYRHATEIEALTAALVAAMERG